MKPDAFSGSDCRKMSVAHIELIFEHLQANQTRKSTQKNYHCIWKLFNKFLLQLDNIPISWEQRISLFGVYLVERGSQSSTLRSYVAAIKSILCTDKIKLDADKIMLGTIA